MLQQIVDRDNRKRILNELEKDVAEDRKPLTDKMNYAFYKSAVFTGQQ